MDIHYNAFISYRHHPDDIRVAKEVHKALERFKIPKPIRKKANFKGPMRLFRDKEELPITSNLNDDIGDALRNADFLIVICSVHTKESIWVQREIELFLKSHDRNHVLTVLASGEPYDVIPEILLYNDVVDPVTGEVTRELVEPLSCDWRIGRRKAKREELPRLAAPLLGCAYDELRQRQRQYRMRRLITFFSIALAASLGLAAYFLQTSITIARQNVEIQKNLEQSQRNQSRHLATAAQERLAEGDRLTAIALAAAALPCEDNVRPYVAEAELTLTDALGVYQENSEILAVGAVSPGSQSTITEFWASPSGKLLYLYDMRKHVTVWDTATMEKLGDWDHSQESVNDLIPAGQDLALVMCATDGQDTLKCVKPDGAVLWQAENCVDAMAAEDGNTVVLIVQKDVFDYELQLRDLQTGEPVREPGDMNLFGSLMSPWQFSSYSLQEGMPILVEYSAYPDKKVCMFDWQTFAHTELPAELSEYPQLLITGDNRLIAMSYGTSDVYSGKFDDNRVNSTIRRQVSGYDLMNGTKLWQAEVASSVSSFASLHEIPDGRILCQSGPVFQVMDPATGEVLNRCEAGSSAYAVAMGDGHAQAILEDGYVCYYWYDGNYCYEEKCLQSGVYRASIRDAYFTMQRLSNQVTIYRETEPPTKWGLYTEDAITIVDQRIYGDQWLFWDGRILYLFDLQEQDFRWQQELPIRDLLEFSDDGTKLWIVGGDGALQTVDAATGEVKTDSPDITQDNVYAGLLRDGKFCYVAATGKEDGTLQAHLKVLDFDTKEIAAFEVPAETEEGEYIRYEIAGQWGQYLWVFENTGRLMELNLTTGDRRILAEEMAQCPVIVVNEDGTAMAITAAETVLVTAPGTEDMQILVMEEDALAGSLYFYGSDLLVLCNNGYLYRYNVEGALQSRTELEVGERFSRDLLDAYAATQASVSFQLTRDQKLVVNAFNRGNVIDCETWKVSAHVPAYHLYWEADNSFVCNSYYSAFAGYPVYSLEELLQLAEEKLGSYELTEEQKAGYGLA